MATVRQRAGEWTAKTRRASPSTKSRKSGDLGVYGTTSQFTTVLRKFTKKGTQNA